MKLTIFYNLMIVLLTISSTSCTERHSDVEITQNSLAAKLHISKTQKRTTPKISFVIYDYKEAQFGLKKVLISPKYSSGNTKEDIIQAFLKHNHILKEADQVTLLKIEEVGKITNFYLSSIQDLVKPSKRMLFDKALELTLLRHLKSSDFNIVYNETALVMK